MESICYGKLFMNFLIFCTKINYEYVYLLNGTNQKLAFLVNQEQGKDIYSHYLFQNLIGNINNVRKLEKESYTAQEGRNKTCFSDDKIIYVGNLRVSKNCPETNKKL